MSPENPNARPAAVPDDRPRAVPADRSRPVLHRVPYAPPARAFKRGADVVLTSLLLLALSPLMLLVALAIVVDSPGSPLFKQRRRGRGGRHFWMYKFRSMHRGADRLRDQLLKQAAAGGLDYKIKDDPRVTRVGRVIRRFSIDELPQLFNVLRGDMSLVGPRPFSEGRFEAAKARGQALFDRWTIERHYVRPGCTGLWQVGGRNDLSFEQLARLDLRYVHEWSPRLDAYILARTAGAVLSRRGAY